MIETTNKSQNRPPFLNWLERWKPALEAIGIVVIVASAVIALTQWKTSNEANVIAKAALDQNRETMERQLRPYVLPARLTLEGDLKDRAVGVVEVENSGQTPAVDLEGCADFAILPNTAPMTDTLACPNPNMPTRGSTPTGERSAFALAPGSRGFMLRTAGTSINTTPDGFEAIRVGAMRIYVYGDVTYSDLVVPQAKRKTQFCGRLNPDLRTFSVCESHNTVY